MRPEEVHGKDKKYITVSNSRSKEQEEVMRRIHEADECPFCESNLQKYHKEPIIFEGTFWRLTKNQWPYDHTKNHLLLIHKTHIEKLSEITTESFEELGELIFYAEKKYGIEGGAFAMRFGKAGYTGSSVRHLHAQLIEPDIKNQNYTPVRFKIGDDQ